MVGINLNGDLYIMSNKNKYNIQRIYIIIFKYQRTINLNNLIQDLQKLNNGLIFV